MARPKKLLPPSKPHQISVRFTNELYEVLSKNASQAHMTKGEYIRQLIAGKRPIIHQEVVFENKELLEVFRNIGKIGGNLNQIARHLNQGEKMTNEAWKIITDCISQLLQMRDEIKEMAGEYRGNS